MLVPRLVVCSDIDQWSAREPVDQDDLVRRLVDGLDTAWDRTGVGPEHRQSTGDGTREILAPGVPVGPVAHRFVRELDDVLRTGNRNRTGPGVLRVRLVVGFGDAGWERGAVTGARVGELCRILDAPVARAALATAHLAALVDPYVHTSLTATGLDDGGWAPVLVGGKAHDRTGPHRAHLRVHAGPSRSGPPPGLAPGDPSLPPARGPY